MTRASIYGGAATLESEVLGSQTCVLCETGQHSRSEFIAVVKREDDICPSLSVQNAMGAPPAYLGPSDPSKSGQYLSRFRRRPLTHCGTLESARPGGREKQMFSAAGTVVV